MTTKAEINELIVIRKNLHKMPEASGEEEKTSKFIKNELTKCGPDNIYENVGGFGIIAEFSGVAGDQAKTIMIRAELDALAIDEANSFDHKSETENRMHACGHDGHMTIVLGVARWLKNNRPENGKVLLLFQPSEETGEGAGQMLADPQFKDLNVDRALALHNLPGKEQNTIFIKENTFALASVGIKVIFEGKSSHAAYPDEGVNPSYALSNFILKLEAIKKSIKNSDRFRVLTVTYVKIGEPAFGINPGKGEVGITIRAESDDSIKNLIAKIKELANDIDNSFKGKIIIEQKEPFSATVNDKEGVDQLLEIVDSLNIKSVNMDEPIAWSEDFGDFRKKSPITLFGIGAGLDSAPLHSEVYDFNDELIPTGIAIFTEWIKRELNG